MTTRTTKQLIEDNNIKRKQLNEEDLKVYENFLLYLRTDLRVSEHETEVILMDVLDHLLESVSNGSSAIEFFGHDVKGHADEILKALPNESRKAIFKMLYMGISYFYSIYFIITGLVLIFTNSKTPIISTLLLIIMVPIGGYIIIKLLFSGIQRYIFDQTKLKQYKEMLYSGVVVGILPALLMLVPYMIFKNKMLMDVPGWVFIALGLIIFIVYKLMKKKTK